MSEQPKYQLLPPLSPDEYDALKDNISERGVLVAVEFDESGFILDGHHRVQICAELGIKDFPKIVRTGLSETEKRCHVRSLNLVRRHLNRMQRQKIIRTQLSETPTISDRAIAARLGVSHVTVGGARKRMERGGQLVHVSTRTDTLGRSQPAHKQRTVYVDQAGSMPDTDKRSVGLGSNGAAGCAPPERHLESDKATNGGAAIGTKSASRQERGDDLYETPRCAIVTLLEIERFDLEVWEPACGRGAISQVLEDKGYDVELSDLVDRGCADGHGEVQRAEDFLSSKKRDGFCPDIITNPPFGIINQFIAHALREHGPQKVAMLCNLNVLAGADNPDRNFWMDEHPPARIHVFSRRLPMMHRDGFEGEKSGSQMNCVWLVWERPHDGTFPTEPPRLFRHDWKKVMAAAGEGDWRPDE